MAGWALVVSRREALPDLYIEKEFMEPPIGNLQLVFGGFALWWLGGLKPVSPVGELAGFLVLRGLNPQILFNI